MRRRRVPTRSNDTTTSTSATPGKITAPQPADTTGQQLRHQREGTGLTISELARGLDVPYQRLRRLETGERVDPDLAARARAHLEHLALLAA